MSRVLLNSSGNKLLSTAKYLQSLRLATGIAIENASSFDKETLAAAKPFEDLPSIKMLPVFGTGWIFLPIIGKYKIEEFTRALLEKRKTLGTIFREKFGAMNFVVSFNADDLQTMYQNEGPYPRRTDLEVIKMYRELRKDLYKNPGLVVLNGKEWHDLRSMTQKHLMKPKAVIAFLNPMQDVAKDFIDKVKRERDVNLEMPDLLGELYKWSLESVSLVGLDTRLGCLETNLPPDSDGVRMIQSIQTSFECLLKLETVFGNIPFWKYFTTPTLKKFIESSDTFTEITQKHINRSLENLKSKVHEGGDLTLLQTMLLTKGMDTSSTLVMIGDMMGAGIDTTSHTVGFFLYNIAKNPDKQELLYQHLKVVLPRKEDRITPSVFNELRYLKACIKESQRLDPIVGSHVRILDHDVIFSGYRIPAGTVLLSAIQGIFRDERYFSNPDKFLPERWLSKEEKFHPFAFLPFGFGTRSCIGRRIAELEIICLTAELIRNFKIEYHHEDINIYTRLINVPDRPLRFTFVER